jgi:hypothetical protein
MRAGLSSPRPPLFRKYECPFAAQWSGRVAAATDFVIAIQIGVTGFEPATSWSQTTRSTKLSYTPACGLMNITRCNPAHLESWYCRCERLQIAEASAGRALPIEK